jgi:hypothetical protein
MAEPMVRAQNQYHDMSAPETEKDIVFSGVVTQRTGIQGRVENRVTNLFNPVTRVLLVLQDTDLPLIDSVGEPLLVH